MVQIKLDLEKIALIAFFTVFLFIGMGALFDNKIKHEFPYAYLASDAFQHQVRAESIKDAGNYRNEASYVVAGYEGAVGYYPPILYTLSVMLSYLSGLETYDTIYFEVFFFAGLAALLMYFITRHLSRNVAIISLPLSFLIFSGGLYTGFTWGHWPSLLAQVFLVGVIWYTSKIDMEKSYIFLGVYFAGTIMTHTSETVFAGIYLILFFIMNSIVKKIDFGVIKNLVLGGIISFVITSYYLIIFLFVWMKVQPYKFLVQPIWEGNPTIYIADFKLLLLFMLAGAIASLFFIKKNFVPALMSFAILAFGFTNYIGFRDRAFELRYFWPVYLSFFIAFGIYHILKIFIKEWRLLYSAAIAAAIGLIIVMGNVSFMPFYSKLQTSGIMNNYHWEAFKWIEKNTEKNKNIYFFYGDTYSSDALLRNTKRTHYMVLTNDFVDAINKKEIRKAYGTEMPADGGAGTPYRKTLFSYGDYAAEMGESFFIRERNICDFDYFVFDKASRQKVLADYNMLIASELVKKGAEVAFQNGLVLVIKNNKIGGDCIEKRNF